MVDIKLLQEYNVAVPRYTSYPTVPYWKDGIDPAEWQQAFSEQFKLQNAQQGISLYMHLPFCESLCTYCGCNKKITTNHSVEDEYIAAILKEWHMYLASMGQPPLIRELHLGGGTPTFFSPANLNKLLSGILQTATLGNEYDFSLEGHPNNTTKEHLQTLYNLGFRRISYGVQDNDENVQRVINRIQPFENVKRATETAREIGYTSVNFDLIYGLPLQTTDTIHRTIERSISLRPDRVAFYSYAHVPWTSRGQRLFDENDLPTADEKLQLYITGKNLFIENGYHDIGMDHFALPTDDLYIACTEGTLHRNFMGYTTKHSALLVGLGVSAISDSGNAYAQNEKTIHEYYSRVNTGQLAVRKGYFLNEEDKLCKQAILNISCKGISDLPEVDTATLNKYVLPKLKKLEQDGLVQTEGATITVTPLGKHFIRNICSAFDIHLLKTKEEGVKQYSKSI